jgi:hypothetical protein
VRQKGNQVDARAQAAAALEQQVERKVDAFTWLEEQDGAASMTHDFSGNAGGKVARLVVDYRR